jgi:hypothetical protein
MRAAFALLVISTLVPSVPSKRDGCRVVDPENIVRVQGAYVVLPTQELFPLAGVRASGDDQYWGCWRNGILGDLYIPPGDPADEGIHSNPMEPEEAD